MALHSRARVDAARRSGRIDEATYETLIEHFEEEDPADPIPWTPTKPHDQVQLDWLEKVLMERARRTGRW